MHINSFCWTLLCIWVYACVHTCMYERLCVHRCIFFHLFSALISDLQYTCITPPPPRLLNKEPVHFFITLSYYSLHIDWPGTSSISPLLLTSNSSIKPPYHPDNHWPDSTVYLLLTPTTALNKKQKNKACEQATQNPFTHLGHCLGEDREGLEQSVRPLRKFLYTDILCSSIMPEMLLVKWWL